MRALGHRPKYAHRHSATSSAGRVSSAGPALLRAGRNVYGSGEAPCSFAVRVAAEADEALESALRGGLAARPAMAAARDQIAERCACSKRRAANELRDAMIRRAATHEATRKVAEAYLREPASRGQR